MAAFTSVERLPDSESADISNEELNQAFTTYEKEVKVQAKLQKVAEQKALEATPLSQKEKRLLLQHAPLVSRLLSFGVDLLFAVGVGLAFGLISFIPSKVANQFYTLNATDIADLFPYCGDLLIAAFCVWIASMFFLGAGRGQTIGQKMFGLQLVDTSRGALNFDQSLLWALSQVSNLLTLGLGSLLALGKQRSTFADRLAGTSVVRADSDREAPAAN